jgi:predicted membrane channel-forming protein YqfA (hemolysin III family)
MNGNLLPHNGTVTANGNRTMAAENLANGSKAENGTAPTKQHSSKEEHSNNNNMQVSKLSDFKLLPTTHRDGVPALFREPHVNHGFRPLHQPWYYYLFTVFQLHNESMNVWTHLIAFVLMSEKLLRFSGDVDFVGDPYSWPMLAGLVCGILLYVFSAGAHCMQSKSELFHYTSFMIDYAGIGLYGLGSVIVHHAYCNEDSFYHAVNWFFVPLGCCFGFAICFCCTIAKVIYTRPYPFVRKIWQMAPVAGVYVLLISPIVHRLFCCFVLGDDCNDSIPYHCRQIFWFLISGFFFASDFPQRRYPGKCDHFFHSHQMFHIAIMICTLYQMEGVYIDFKTRSDLLRQRPEPTFLSALGPVILTIVCEAISIVVFRFKISSYLKDTKKTAVKSD